MSHLEPVVLDPTATTPLDEQARFVLLSDQVHALQAVGRANSAVLSTFRVVHFSSTSTGGGVAEMLRALIPDYGELGMRSEWLVMKPPPALAAPFFATTKVLHNLIHNAAVDASALDLKLYVRVSNLTADAYLHTHGPAFGDTVFICHDPQTAGVGAALKALCPSARVVWRCHIGAAAARAGAVAAPPPSDAAWAFLAPFLARFDAFVFTHPEYVPCCVAGLPGAVVKIIRPGISPESAKNMEMSWHEIASVLSRAHLLSDLVKDPQNKCAAAGAPFPGAHLYRGGGVWDASGAGKQPNPHGVPFLSRPVITQVSRWDALKGWLGLLAGFAHLKQARGGGGGAGPAGGGPAPAPSEREEALICNAVLLLV